MLKLNAKQLRGSLPTEEEIKNIHRRPIYIVCDNVLDTYNIGSIFRLADAVAALGVYLCGASETPPNSRIAKAAVGCEKWVPWEHFESAKEAIEHIKSNVEGVKVIAIEQGKGSVDFRKANYKFPIVFVIGHETEGVSKEALELCDEMVEIPMYGVNISLNVMVSLGIVLFKAV